MDTHKCAIILASGAGRRAGGDIPKQFRLIGGVWMAFLSAMAFSKAGIKNLYIVLPEEYREKWVAYAASRPAGLVLDAVCRLTNGGATRIDSVKAGLELLREDIESGRLDRDCFVAVHDAARPLVSGGMIDQGFLTAADEGKVAVPVVDMTDSLRLVNGAGSLPVDRTAFKAVQTPQIAPFLWLYDSYSRPVTSAYTDDASILQAAGYPIAYYPGEPTNMKVTYPMDFLIAETLLKNISSSYC